MDPAVRVKLKIMFTQSNKQLRSTYLVILAIYIHTLTNFPGYPLHETANANSTDGSEEECTSVL